MLSYLGSTTSTEKGGGFNMTKIFTYIATKKSSKLIRDARILQKKGGFPDWEAILSNPDAQGTTSYKGLKL